MTYGANRPLSHSSEPSDKTPAASSNALDWDLPAFSNPPVIEVAASLQFEAIEELHAARLGLLWGWYRDRYPRVEVHPPLGETRESFGPPSPAKMSISVESMPSALRFWFLNERGTRMLQVQQTRFILNWRKMDSDESYPHYHDIQASLIEEFEEFERFLRGESLPGPTFNQVELTYVNHILASSSGSGRALKNIVRLWGGEPQNSLVGASEDVAFRTRYVMPDRKSPVGRLYVTLETRIRVADSAPVLSLQLIARGAPLGPGLAGALAFMDQGHRWIVQSFADLTTPEMHRVWERTR